METVAVQHQELSGILPQPMLQDHGPVAQAPKPGVPVANHAIRRRPVSVSYRKPVGEKTQLSPVTSISALPIPSPITEGEKPVTNGVHIPQPEAPIQNTQASQGKQESNGCAQADNTSISSNQQYHVSGLYFSPPPGQNSVPTSPASTQPSPQPYFPPPSFQQSAISQYDPSNITRPPYPIYIPTPTGSSSPLQSPGTPSPSQSASYRSPTLPSSPLHRGPSTSKRISTWSKEAANKYWNKETAKRAYRGSKDFLVKTNQKLERVIDPMMPMLSATHPNLAAAYQIGQAVQKPTSPQAAISGMLAAQNLVNNLDGGGAGNITSNTMLPGQTSGGALDSMGSLLAALNQPAAGSPLEGTTDANPLLAMLGQSVSAGTSPDTSAIFAAMMQPDVTNTDASGFVDPSSFAAPTFDSSYTSGADPAAFLAAFAQPTAGTPYGGGADPSAFIAGLTQPGAGSPPSSSQDPNAALISAYIQQQANASTATLLASLNASSGTPFQATPGGFQMPSYAPQDTQAQIMSSILEQLQAQTQAAQAQAASNMGYPPANAQTTYSQPISSQPDYSQPTFSQPDYSQPTFSQPDYSQPASSQPTFSQPDYSQPTPQAGPSYAAPETSQFPNTTPSSTTWESAPTQDIPQTYMQEEPIPTTQGPNMTTNNTTSGSAPTQDIPQPYTQQEPIPTTQAPNTTTNNTASGPAFTQNIPQPHMQQGHIPTTHVPNTATSNTASESAPTQGIPQPTQGNHQPAQGVSQPTQGIPQPHAQQGPIPATHPPNTTTSSTASEPVFTQNIPQPHVQQEHIPTTYSPETTASNTSSGSATTQGISQPHIQQEPIPATQAPNITTSSTASGPAPTQSTPQPHVQQGPNPATQASNTTTGNNAFTQNIPQPHVQQEHIPTTYASNPTTNNTASGPAPTQGIPQPHVQQGHIPTTYSPGPNFASRPPAAAHTQQPTTTPSPPSLGQQQQQQQQPVPVPVQVATPATSWVHHRDLAFGLADMLLPAGHNLASPGPPHLLMGDLHLPGAPGAGRLELRLLYTPAHVRRDALALQALGAGSAPGVRVLEPYAGVDFGGGGRVAGVACAVCVEDEGEGGGEPAVLYRVVLLSPHGHGLTVSLLLAAAAQFPAARALARTMFASLRWADRAAVCRSVAARLLGAWEYAAPAPEGGETKRLVFTPDGRYAYVRRKAPVAVGGQAAAVGGGVPGASDHVRGHFEVYEYEGGLKHLVLTEDSTGGVEVQSVQLGEGVMIVNGKGFLQVKA